MKLLDSGMLKGAIKTKVLGKVRLSVKDGEQIICNGSTTASTSHTIGLIDQRLRWANEFALYSSIKTAIAEGIQNRESGRSDFNYFLQNNQSVLTTPFGITKQQRKVGAAIVFPAVVTLGDGSLRPVVAQGVNDNHLLSNLSIGDLQIGDSTTIGEFAQAIVTNNGGWQMGDQLTYIQCNQAVNSNGPRVRCNYVAIVLTEDNTTTLRSVAKVGFEVESKCLATKPFIGAGCWVHSRRSSTDKSVNLVSSQRLVSVGMDDFHASYRTSEMMQRAAISYGWTAGKPIVLRADDTAAITLAERYAAPYRLVKANTETEELVDFVYCKMGGRTYFFSGTGPEVDTSTCPTLQIEGNYSQLGTITSVKVNGTACTNPTLSGNTLTVTLPVTLDGDLLESIVVASATGSARIEFGGD